MSIQNDFFNFRRVAHSQPNQDGDWNIDSKEAEGYWQMVGGVNELKYYVMRTDESRLFFQRDQRSYYLQQV